MFVEIGNVNAKLLLLYIVQDEKWGLFEKS